jgi:hypothetical protein
LRIPITPTSQQEHKGNLETRRKDRRRKRGRQDKPIETGTCTNGHRASPPGKPFKHANVK